MNRRSSTVESLLSELTRKHNHGILVYLVSIVVYLKKSNENVVVDEKFNLFGVNITLIKI